MTRTIGSSAGTLTFESILKQAAVQKERFNPSEARVNGPVEVAKVMQLDGFKGPWGISIIEDPNVPAGHMLLVDWSRVDRWVDPEKYTQSPVLAYVCLDPETCATCPRPIGAAP